MTIENELILESLLAAKDKVEVGMHYNSGICALVHDWFNLNTELEGKVVESSLKKFKSDIVETWWFSWPMFSSSIRYPINDPDSNLTPGEQYTLLDKWEGTQRELRMDLLNHLIRVYSDWVGGVVEQGVIWSMGGE